MIIKELYVSNACLGTSEYATIQINNVNIAAMAEWQQ